MKSAGSSCYLFLGSAFFAADVGRALPCPLPEIDVRGLPSWGALLERLGGEEDALAPVKLLGVTEGWAAQAWSLTDLVAKLGEVRVWPRDLRATEPLVAARTSAVALREFIAEEPSEAAVFEVHFNELTRALEGRYSVPNVFRSRVHTSPVVGLSRRGSGVGFHAPHGNFALWVAQLSGSTTWGLLPPGTRPRSAWLWPRDLEAAGDSSIEYCTLERGEALFLPRGYSYAFRGEDDANAVFGWQGDTRPMRDLEGAMAAITAGDVLAFSKAAGAFPGGEAGRAHLAPCVNQAMQVGHLAILKSLQKLGASFDEETPTGSTHLHQAASSGQAEAIRYALQDGADPVVKHGKDGSYPIHHAAHAGHGAATEVLLSKAKTSWKLQDSQGRQPLHIAALHGHTAVAAALLQGRAKVDARDRTKFQPLHWAMEGGHAAMAEHLLAGRADLEATSVDGETALHRAAVMGHSGVTAKLLDLRAQIEAERVPGGQTAVHVAAFVGHVGILQLLQSRGANLSPKKKEGQYGPEALAASAGHGAVLELLRGSGGAAAAGRDGAAGEVGEVPVEVRAALARRAWAQSLGLKGAGPGPAEHYVEPIQNPGLWDLATRGPQPKLPPGTLRQRPRLLNPVSTAGGMLRTAATSRPAAASSAAAKPLVSTAASPILPVAGGSVRAPAVQPAHAGNQMARMKGPDPALQEFVLDRLRRRRQLWCDAEDAERRLRRRCFRDQLCRMAQQTYGGLVSGGSWHEFLRTPKGYDQMAKWVDRKSAEQLSKSAKRCP